MGPLRRLVVRFFDIYHTGSFFRLESCALNAIKIEVYGRVHIEVEVYVGHLWKLFGFGTLVSGPLLLLIDRLEELLLLLAEAQLCTRQIHVDSLRLAAEFALETAVSPCQ